MKRLIKRRGMGLSLGQGGSMPKFDRMPIQTL